MTQNDTYNPNNNLKKKDKPENAITNEFKGTRTHTRTQISKS